MTALAGAAFNAKVNWSGIDWKAAHQNVRRLQARIVKAIRENRWGKAKSLQFLLTHSFSAKVLAVKRVTENKGKRTPGVDKEIWDTPEKKAKAVGTLRKSGYKSLPLRRILIPKGLGKQGKRPLSIPTMRDRAMQALYLLALDPIAETMADPNSYGFRRERSTEDAIEQCFTVLAQKRSAQWVMKADILSCFDRILHVWSEANIPMDKFVLRQWLKAGFIQHNILYPTEAGTPQGGIASPVLANMALDGLEKELKRRFPSTKAENLKIHYIRYADDFIITSKSKEMLEMEIRPFVESFLKERGLELSQEKTRITHIEDGFDFLGQNIRKYSGKLLIKPASENVKYFLRKVRKIVKANKQMKAGDLIVQLNSRIRGWANYHRHIVSKLTFSKVDNAIFKVIWQWARRRHRGKTRRWVKEKYFKHIGNRDWIFFGKIKNFDGQIKEVQLVFAAKTPIKRHIKIRGKANPYDSTWEVYFEKRTYAKMLNNLRGRGVLLRLWKRQTGICPNCQQNLTEETGWNIHHIIRRVDGGKDTLKNLLLLHPECHRQIHNHSSK